MNSSTTPSTAASRVSPVSRHRLTLALIALVLVGTGGASLFVHETRASDAQPAKVAAPAGPTVTVASVEERNVINQRELLDRKSVE